MRCPSGDRDKARGVQLGGNRGAIITAEARACVSHSHKCQCGTLGSATTQPSCCIRQSFTVGVRCAQSHARAVAAPARSRLSRRGRPLDHGGSGEGGARGRRGRKARADGRALRWADPAPGGPASSPGSRHGSNIADAPLGLRHGATGHGADPLGGLGEATLEIAQAAGPPDGVSVYANACCRGAPGGPT